MLKTKKCFWCENTKFTKVAARSDGVIVLRCESCGLLQVAERPDDVEGYYLDDYYKPGRRVDTVGYDEFYSLFSPIFLLWQSALLKAITDEGESYNLLDVGCATGNLLEIISQYNENISGEGIDISEYAVVTAKGKGLEVTKTDMKAYSGKAHSLIISLETLEHLYDLGLFATEINKNLTKDGAFIFYVPSVDADEIADQKKQDPRLRTNLEHLIYFTPAFFENEFPKKFERKALIHEVKTDFGRSIVGIISNNQDMLDGFTSIWEIVDNVDEKEVINSLKKGGDKLTESAILIAAKFGRSERAARLLPLAPAQRREFLSSVLNYHIGDVVASIKNLTSYYLENPRDKIALEMLLADERIQRETLQGEVLRLGKLEGRLFSAEAEINDYKKSRILKNAMLLRNTLRYLERRLDDYKRGLRAKLVAIVPRRLRVPLKYILQLKWLVKRSFVSNEACSSDNPLVTVITPFYNHGATITETFESVLSQTFQNFEYIIVDDGSGPDQAAVLKKLQHEKVQIISHPTNRGNGSPAAARNTGAKLARGKYIMCLDADDIIDPSYIEKAVLILETDPNISLVTTHMRLFGAQNSIYYEARYNPKRLMEDNMVVTSALYRINAWREVGGYKEGIGYEDWEYWINLAEKGFWGKLIPEPLLNYRTAISSRYVDDQQSHADNILKIKELHPSYQKNIRKLYSARRFRDKRVVAGTEFINLNNISSYADSSDKDNVLILVPWMTFGGAETLVTNFTLALKEKFNFHFITLLESPNEWEWKYKMVTQNIYHLPHIIDQRLRLDFISNYIVTRNIKILHAIHNKESFEFIAELRKRHPDLKIVITMFNKEVSFFKDALSLGDYIDSFTSDNSVVIEEVRAINPKINTVMINNGIDIEKVYNPDMYLRGSFRTSEDIPQDARVVTFVGRLSEEKNPDFVVDLAKKMIGDKKTLFILVGDGPLRNHLEAKAKGLANIRLLGQRADIPDILRDSDVFLLPSKVEGSPQTILEAMAMGNTVFASAVGGVKGLIADGEDGYTIVEPDIETVARLIGNLKNNSMGAAARSKAVKEFSIEKMKRAYSLLYEDLLVRKT